MSRRGADWLSRARVAVDGQRQALRHRQPLATDLAKLRMRAEFPDRRRSTVRCVTGNVRAMHADPELERALFQVASQFNLLEMTGPSITPEDGVTRYSSDHTQGPACAIAAGAATIYRNYFVPVDGEGGQTRERELNALVHVGAALSARLDRPVSDLWTMRNGYALLHAWWVEPGHLLAGEYPGARTPQKAAQKVRLLIDAGVDSIVDLTTPDDHLDPYHDALEVVAAKVGRQVQHFAHPIPDMGVIDPEGYDAIVARIRAEMHAGRVVFVHCWGGKRRTSTRVGCLLIDARMDYDSAIARIAELREGTRKAHEACPESPVQHRALRERAAQALSRKQIDMAHHS